MAVHAFSPDYLSPPGVTLRDTLDDQGMSQSDLSTRTGLTEKTISQILNGIAPISYETAAKLEMVLGVPSSFWSARESDYRAALLLREERTRLASMVDWLKLIPYRLLIERGYIDDASDKGALVHNVLKFFGVSSVDAWNELWLTPQLQFRGGKAHDKHPGFVATWVRMGEINAHAVECATYDPKKFKDAVQDIRGMTILKASEWKPKMIELCAAAGVAVVFVREIANAGVSGVTKWLSKDKAVIMLSLMYKRADQLWFSFFHEACHVLKHSKKTVFYEFGKHSDDPLEIEANEFARNLLISPESAVMLPHLKTRAQITDFAAQNGIHAGIVVGRMHRDKLLDPKQGDDMRVKLQWESE